MLSEYACRSAESYGEAVSLGRAMEEATRAMLVLGVLIGITLAGFGWLVWWLIHKLNWSWS